MWCIALASCEEAANISDIAVAELSVVRASLSKLDIASDVVVWDDASVNWDNYDAVVVCQTWDYTTKYPAFSRWMEEVTARSMLVNPAPILKWNSDKIYLKEFAERGLPIIPTLWLARSDYPDGFTTQDLLRTAGWGESDGGLGLSSLRSLIVKPSVGCSSYDIELINATDSGTTSPDTAAAVSAHVQKLLAGTQSTVLVQPFLQAVKDFGELSVVYLDGKYSHAVQKVPASNDFRVQPEYGGSMHALQPPAAALRLCEGVMEGLAAVSMREGVDAALYVRIDLIPSSAHYKETDGEAKSPPWLICEVELLEPELFFAPAARFKRDRRRAELGQAVSVLQLPVPEDAELDLELELGQDLYARGVQRRLREHTQTPSRLELRTPIDVLRFWFGTAYGQEQEQRRWMDSVPYLQSRMGQWFMGACGRFDEVQRQHTALLEAVAGGACTGNPVAAEWAEETPTACMARILLFDQFPRCIFRGTAAAFQYEPQAVAAVQVMLDRGWLDPKPGLKPEGSMSVFSAAEVFFAIVALQHSEKLRLQETGVDLAQRLLLAEPPSGSPRPRVALTEWLRTLKGFPMEHLEVVQRFHRFPSRNGALVSIIVHLVQCSASVLY